MLITDLPQKTQELLKDPNRFGIIENIGKKYSLHIDQVGDISVVVQLLLTGEISAKNFTKELQERLELDHTTVENIARDVNEQVLKPLRQQIVDASSRDLVADLEYHLKSDLVPPAPTEDYSALKARDILHEIENPYKTDTVGPVTTQAQPVSVPAQNPAPAASVAAAPIITIRTPTPTPTPIKPLVEGTGINLIDAAAKPPLIPNLVEQKLTQTVRAPEPQKIELVEKAPSKLPPIVPKLAPSPIVNAGGPDPYREPIA